jgi:hypothetical protein
MEGVVHGNELLAILNSPEYLKVCPKVNSKNLIFVVS